MTDNGVAVRKYVTEFVGTFVFAFAVIGIVVADADIAAKALGIGAALMVMVYASGHISGGHLNPSVSIAAYLRGALGSSDLGPYIAAQLLGALGAFGLGFALWREAYYVEPAVDLDGNVWAALVAELVFTFALCYIVLHTATSRDSAGNSFYGLAIGFIVTVGVVAVGAVSGASFNPAVTFALMLPGLFSWKYIWVYLLAELAGAGLAAYAYQATNLEDQRSSPARSNRR